MSQFHDVLTFRLGLSTRCILEALSLDPSQGFADGPRRLRADETARGVVLRAFSNELRRNSVSLLALLRSPRVYGVRRGVFRHCQSTSPFRPCHWFLRSRNTFRHAEPICVFPEVACWTGSLFARQFLPRSRTIWMEFLEKEMNSTVAG